MGAENTKLATQPLLSEPWRKIDWTKDKEKDLMFVKSYKPQTECQQIRILLHGPCGAGKSTFINSVQSMLQGRMYLQALADNISHDSFTKKYTTYKIQKEDPSTFYPFVFNDIMGLDPDKAKGVLVEDVRLALNGHVKDGYVFNPVHRITQDNQFYKSSPDLIDKVHVLVLVIDANTLILIGDKVIEKMKNIRTEASVLGIPQVAIITKIDAVCPEVQKDLQSVYKVTEVEKKMELLSAETGIPMNCIFPVKNYHKEIHLDNNIDTLILSALRQIIISGEDHIKFLKNKNPSPGNYA